MLTAASRAGVGTAALVAVLAVGCSDDEPPTASVTFSKGSAGITVVAEGTSYSVERVEVQAGGTTTITLENRDTVPHTLTVYLGAALTDKVVAGSGEVAAGERGEAIVFFASQGEQVFRCDIHPDQMSGTLIIR